MRVMPRPPGGQRERAAHGEHHADHDDDRRHVGVTDGGDAHDHERGRDEERDGDERALAERCEQPAGRRVERAPPHGEQSVGDDDERGRDHRAQRTGCGGLEQPPRVGARQACEQVGVRGRHRLGEPRQHGDDDGERHEQGEHGRPGAAPEPGHELATVVASDHADGEEHLPAEDREARLRARGEDACPREQLGHVEREAHDEKHRPLAARERPERGRGEEEEGAQHGDDVERPRT
jgi:hypothetical protein